MLNLYTYRLPFKRPLVTAAGSFAHREGLLLRYHDDEIDLVSEIAPLPGFSDEDLNEALEQGTSIKKELESLFSGDVTISSLNKWLHDQTLYPSVEFGVSSMGLSIVAVRAQSPLHSLLDCSRMSPVSVNAVLGIMDPESFKRQAESYIAEGFRVIKCKVTEEPGHLPLTMSELAENHKGLSFRLDANRSWPLDKLEELSTTFHGLPIEYIEEPCLAENIPQLNDVITRSRIPVAADESIMDFGLEAVLEHTDPLPYLVIKPTLYGNLLELFATIGARYHLENRVILPLHLSRLSAGV